jgi:hemerythrin superfamily protein
MDSTSDIVQLILKDHEALKKLSDLLKDSNTFRAKKEGAFECFVPLLLAHAKAEEKSLYLQMKEVRELKMVALEGDTEHALAEQLIREINSEPDDDNWNAKVMVLAEIVAHHIEEEEDAVLLDVEEKMSQASRTSVGLIYSQIKSEMEALHRPRATQARRPPADYLLI